MRVINCDENGKLPHGLIWRDGLPPNLPHFAVDIRKCEPKDLVAHLMNERNFDGRRMKDFHKKCIKSIPDGLDAGLNDAKEDAAEDDNAEDNDAKDDDAEDDDAEDDDAKDDASNDIVDLTNESEINSRRSSKRARQKPDWYGGLRGDYSTNDDDE
jgi:hypothetical protein